MTVSMAWTPDRTSVSARRRVQHVPRPVGILWRSSRRSARASSGKGARVGGWHPVVATPGHPDGAVARPRVPCQAPRAIHGDDLVRHRHLFERQQHAQVTRACARHLVHSRECVDLPHDMHPSASRRLRCLAPSTPAAPAVSGTRDAWSGTREPTLGGSRRLGVWHPSERHAARGASPPRSQSAAATGRSPPMITCTPRWLVRPITMGARRFIVIAPPSAGRTTTSATATSSPVMPAAAWASASG